MPAEERRGALPHPTQLAADLLCRAVGDATQRLVQSGKWCAGLVLGVTHSLTLPAVPDENKAWLLQAGDTTNTHCIFVVCSQQAKADTWQRSGL